MAAKFVVSTAKSGKFHFVLKAGNGEVILSSQMYASVTDALNGVQAVKDNAGVAERFQKLTSKKGEPYFTLMATNGQVVGNSEMYSSERSRDGGIASVMKNAAGAAVDNQTAKS